MPKRRTTALRAYKMSLYQLILARGAPVGITKGEFHDQGDNVKKIILLINSN
jgi:hypothetical protein